MSADRCPSPEELNHLSDDSLSEHEFFGLTEHLQSCQQCAETVRSLETSDAIEMSLRQCDALWKEADCEFVSELMAQLAAFVWPISGGDSSRAGHASTTDSDRDTSSETLSQAISEIIKLLEPAQHDGDLGCIGSYRILDVIGVGGMGVVFEAEDAELCRRIALKVMTPATARKAFSRERFLREARSIAAIYHDNIVPIHRVDTHRELPYFVMPLLRGETLEARLRRRNSLELSEALRIGSEVADGLAAAHQENVIHRDIKPANIWLESRPSNSGVTSFSQGTKNDRAVILDFGLARSLDAAAALTRTGGIAGTPSYMSPEQARGESLDARTDLFSLGSVLYECLTGQLPFQGTNVMASLLALALRTPKPIGELRADVPVRVSEFVMSLLEKQPQDRPDSAKEVAGRLRELQRHVKLDPGSASPTEVKKSSGPTRISHSFWFKSILSIIFLSCVALAAVVFRFQTSEGTVVLEFEDGQANGAKVSVDDEKTIVVESQHMATPLTIRVDKGTHELQVVKDGFELFTKEFELKSRGRKTIHVRLEPKRAVPSADAMQDDPTRRAIAWVCSVGGYAHGYIGDTPGEFSLPHLEITDQPLSIYRIHFDYRAVKPEDITGENLSCLRGLTSIELLRLPLTQTLSDECISHIQGLESLRGLSLSGQPGITDDGVRKLARLKNLENLDLRGTSITNEGLRALNGLKHLRKIDVRETTVSRSTTEEFQSNLPDCVVVSDHTNSVIYSREAAARVQGFHVTAGRTLVTPGRRIAVSPDGTWMATESGYSPAIVTLANINESTSREVFSQSPGFVQCIDFTSDGKQLAIVMNTGRVTVLDVASSQELSSFRLRTDFAPGMGFANDGLLWFAEPYDAKSVSIYDIAESSSKRLATPGMHRLAFSLDGKSVALHRWGVGVVEIRDVVTTRIRQTIRMLPEKLRAAHAGGFEGIALSSDGELLASAGSDGVVRMWDVKSGTQRKAMLGHVHLVHRVAFSPDGRLLASSGSDNTVRIWDVVTGDLLVSLVAHRHIVASLYFSSDGRQLFSGSWDGTARIWHLE